MLENKLGWGGIKIPYNYSENSPTFLQLGTKTLVWFSIEVKEKTETVSEIVGETTLAFLYPLVSVTMMWFCPQLHWCLGYSTFI